MDIQESFSGLKKKLKHPLTRTKHKLARTEADAGGESVDATGSLPQPGPHVIAGGADAVQRRLLSTDRPPQPDGEENTE